MSDNYGYLSVVPPLGG